MAEPRFRVETLQRHHDRTRFRCGEPSLANYLQQQARQDMSRNLTAVFVLVDVTDEQIAGYYTLSACSLGLESLPEALRRKRPRYDEIPAILLGRLAVDQRCRGQGLGRAILADALRRVLAQRNEFGVWAVVVDALNEDARAFYERFGFERIPDEPYRLFLPLQTIDKVDQLLADQPPRG